MTSVVIQIGNSDDKLTQSEWQSFVNSVRSQIAIHVNAIHFFGAPPNYERWQNACWVVGCENNEQVQKLKNALTRIRKTFGQDSIAWLVGDVEFI